MLISFDLMRCDIQESAMQLSWHIGDVIGKVREMRGMTREKLAAESKLSAYSMGQIEKTGSCRYSTLERIASALKVSVAFLSECVPSATAPLQTKHAFACDNPEHTNLHKWLEEILNGQRKDADEWRNGIIANLRAMRLAALIGDAPPEGSHKRKTWEDVDIGSSAPIEEAKQRRGKK